MIEINNITKIIDERKIIDNISFSIELGKITGFIGVNGSGKTTTLNILTGILSPNSGTVKVNGIDLKKNHIEAKRLFTFVSDEPNMFLKLSGIEYLNFISNVYNVDEDVSNYRMKILSKRFGMENVLKNRIEDYSHGMRQKILIIGSLIPNPHYWILDEPLTGLDTKSIYELKKIMREHANNNNAVFFSSHSLDIVNEVCDKVIILDDGIIKFDNELCILLDKSEGKSLEEVFLDVTER